MGNLMTWLSSIGFDIPGLSWFVYVIAGVILLVVIDAFLSLLFAGIHTLFSGGRR